MASAAEFQHTLAKAVSLSGTSLHTGARVSLKIQPAAANSGIKFKRKDLQDEPTIDATIANVKTVERATTIGEGSMRVHTVEHVLAALSGLGVDNAMIEMDANEPPIGDGSALMYVEAIRKAGVVPLEAPRLPFTRESRSRLRQKAGRSLSCCRTTNFGSPAPRRDRRGVSHSSCRPQ